MFWGKGGHERESSGVGGGGRAERDTLENFIKVALLSSSRKETPCTLTPKGSIPTFCPLSGSHHKKSHIHPPTNMKCGNSSLRVVTFLTRRVIPS